jgi:predicted RNA-binding protein
MCESTAYLKTKDGEIKVMENVVQAIPRNGEVFLEDILGYQKTISGYLTEIRLLEHRMLIDATELSC